MPLFEFLCTSCGVTFEQLVRTTKSPQAILCPVCKSGETQKLLSGFAVKHSGGGSSSASAADCAPGGT